MKSSTSTKNFLVKILGLLLLLNITLLANNHESVESNYLHTTESSMLVSTTVGLSEIVEVSLDSFSNVGILIMIVLSSVLGAFFVKDELSEVFNQ